MKRDKLPPWHHRYLGTDGTETCTHRATLTVYRYGLARPISPGVCAAGHLLAWGRDFSVAQEFVTWTINSLAATARGQRTLVLEKQVLAGD
jgi:hypothetical protein